VRIHADALAGKNLWSHDSCNYCVLLPANMSTCVILQSTLMLGRSQTCGSWLPGRWMPALLLHLAGEANQSRASTDCSCCSLDQRGAPSSEQKYGEWHSQVLCGQHVLANAFCQGFPAAAGIDATRAALRAQVLQHQRPQVVVNLQCT
jgi:hypothetical protein